MADAYTATTTLDYSTKAYQRKAYFAMRPELMYDALADVFATDQSHPGTSVQFNTFGELAIASTALNETQDVSAVTPTDTTSTITLAEYGNVLMRTRMLQATSFIEIDPALANLIGFNAGISIDAVAKTALQAGTNVAYGGTQTARTGITAGDVITAHNVRVARAFLARNNAMKFITGQGGGAAPAYGEGSFDQMVSNPGTGWFAAMIHPDVSLDLREQTGSGAWRVPNEYASGLRNEIWAGELGSFEGFRFVENSRAPYFVQGGASNQNIYGTLFLGKQALAKIWATVEGNAPTPQVVEGPVTDRLKRFRPIGWYWNGGFGRFRENCLYRVETSASTGGTLTTSEPSIDQ